MQRLISIYMQRLLSLNVKSVLYLRNFSQCI